MGEDIELMVALSWLTPSHKDATSYLLSDVWGALVALVQARW